jgi:NADH dehydrogenase
MSEDISKQRKHIVVIGAGFAGVQVARQLQSAPVRVTIIDQHNFHLFQPLLYQVATAALSPADICEPVRRMLRGQANGEVLLGEVTAISCADRQLTLSSGATISYDVLVVASGATHSYFGHDEWEKFAPSLKNIEDARRIRLKILTCFENAEEAQDDSERKRLMTFVIVGGGPSGVELAGSIAELARHALAKDFHHLDSKSTRVILLEAGPRILSAFPKTLSQYAKRKLARLGVTVRENCAVKNVAKNSVQAGGDDIPVGLAIWAAGVKASPVGKMLGVPIDKTGRVRVAANLSVPTLRHVYALGDVALFDGKDGKPLPGLAQVAKQQGHYLGQALAKQFSSRPSSSPFVFHDRGNVAIIGRHVAVADFGWWRVTGRLAWMLWALVHIYLLAGLQHRVLVAVQWLWKYFTYDRGARLILEPLPPRDGGTSC